VPADYRPFPRTTPTVEADDGGAYGAASRAIGPTNSCAANPAETGGIVQLDSQAIAKESHHPIGMAALAMEIGEQADRNGRTLAADQKVRVALRRQIVGIGDAGAVGQRRRDQEAGSDRLGQMRSADRHPALWQSTGLLTEPKIDSGRERLGLERLIERVRPRSAPHEIGQRPVRPERGIDSQVGELLGQVAGRRPDLQALEVAAPREMR